MKMNALLLSERSVIHQMTKQRKVQALITVSPIVYYPKCGTR